MIDPDTFTIRRALPTDAVALARMRYAFRAELGSVVESAAEFEARARAWFATQLQAATWYGWVAVDAETLIGHCFLQLIDKVPNPVVEAEQIGYITNLYVIPAARGHGLGRQLIQPALDHCAAMQIDSIILWPSARSKPLYRRLGFRPAAQMMELRRSPDAARADAT